MKNINKIIAYSLCTLLIISTVLHYSYKKVFAIEVPSMLIDESFVETWLFPIFSLNNEWSFGQSGINLKDAIEESAGSDNLSYSTDFNNAYAQALNINNIIDPFDLSNADEFFTAYFSTSVDYNKYVAQHKIQDIQEYLTSEESEAIADALIDTQKMQLLGYNSKSEAFADCIVATIQIGKQKMLVAFDEAGEWLGNSFQNILTQVEQLTSTEKQNIIDASYIAYPQNSLNMGTSSVMWKRNANTNWILSSTYGDFKIFPMYAGNGNATFFLLSNTNGVHYGQHSVFGNVEFYFNYSIGNFYYTTATYASFDSFTYYPTQQQYLDYFNSVNALTDIPPYTVPLVDEQSVPYEVPSINGLAQTIDHIYPAIDALRDTVITIPREIADAISLIDTVPADIAEDIAEAISDAIADAISIPDIFTDTMDPDNPNPDPDDPDNPLPEYPPELPSWFWPTLFPDVFDFKGLEIFKPIFDIVGNSYSMYSVWSLIPAIIIFVVIIYFIISVL